jgi:hypothetical protein
MANLKWWLETKSFANLGIAFTTAQRAIEQLERLKIVKQVGDAKRDRVYCANALLDILEEPAQLTPARLTDSTLNARKAGKNVKRFGSKKELFTYLGL